MQQSTDPPQDAAPRHANGRWVLLLPHVAVGQGSLRVRVWRLLQRSGAALAHHGVWVLPNSPDHLQRARVLVRRIEEAGGRCALCAASLIEGLADAALEELFREARRADYARLSRDARALLRRVTRRVKPTTNLAADQRAFLGLERRLADVRAITFVSTEAQRDVETLVAALRRAILIEPADGAAAGLLRARTWVTRQGVFVDRISSAWLIRRFIDPAAIFRFVDPAVHTHAPGELRFDMSPAEYGHEGDCCTFEILCLRFGLADAGHVALGQMVHDLDCREARYARSETAGFLRLLEGIAATTTDDLARIDLATPVLDALYRGLNTAPPPSSPVVTPPSSEPP